MVATALLPKRKPEPVYDPDDEPVDAAALVLAGDSRAAHPGRLRAHRDEGGLRMDEQTTTLTDEDIVTTPTTADTPRATTDDADTSDTGDDTGDTSDTTDTGDDSGDVSDTSDTGDDAA